MGNPTQCDCKKWQDGVRPGRDASYPMVSVITAVFNGASHIAGCIESVIGQDYPNLEHIIIDGGSDDATVDILRSYDSRIAFWKSERDRGIYDAWNKGLAAARGEWICFLGADDEFFPGAVSSYMRVAVLNPEADYISSQVKRVHPNGYCRNIGKPWDWTLFKKKMCTAHVGSMHRRTLFDRFGAYDVSYRTAADYEFLLRPRAQLRAAYFPQVTIMMRAGGASDSSKALREAIRAKVCTGGRNRLMAEIEFQVYNAKSLLNRIRFRIVPLVIGMNGRGAVRSCKIN